MPWVEYSKNVKKLSTHLGWECDETDFSHTRPFVSSELVFAAGLQRWQGEHLELLLRGNENPVRLCSFYSGTVVSSLGLGDRYPSRVQHLQNQMEIKDVNRDEQNSNKGGGNLLSNSWTRCWSFSFMWRFCCFQIRKFHIRHVKSQNLPPIKCPTSESAEMLVLRSACSVRLYYKVFGLDSQI